jgi:hypothetical protein
MEGMFATGYVCELYHIGVVSAAVDMCHCQLHIPLYLFIFKIVRNNMPLFSSGCDVFVGYHLPEAIALNRSEDCQAIDSGLLP